MTEERMIITKEQWKVIDDLLGWVPWDKDERETKYAWIEPTEIAPPKGFKPKCYYTRIGLEYIPLCFSCDIRESCIYKRE